MIQSGFDLLNVLSGGAGGGSERVRAGERPEAERSFSSVLGDAQRSETRAERSAEDRGTVRNGGDEREVSTRTRSDRTKAEEKKGRSDEAGDRETDLTDAASEAAASETPVAGTEAKRETGGEGESVTGTGSGEGDGGDEGEVKAAARVVTQQAEVVATGETKKGAVSAEGEESQPAETDSQEARAGDVRAAGSQMDAKELIGGETEKESSGEVKDGRGDEAAAAAAAAAQRADRAASGDVKRGEDRGQQVGRTAVADAGQQAVEAATEEKAGTGAEGDEGENNDDGKSNRGRATEANRALSAFSDRGTGAGSGTTTVAGSEVAVGRAEAGAGQQAIHHAGAGAANAATSGMLGDGEAGEGQDQRVADQAGRALRAALNQRGGTVTMRLNPPELGSLRVELRMDQNNVRATFDASSEQARSALTQHLSSLKASLQTHGLNVESLTVQHSNSAGNDQLARDGGEGSDDGRSRGSFDRSNGGEGDGGEQGEGREAFEEELVDLLA